MRLRKGIVHAYRSIVHTYRSGEDPDDIAAAFEYLRAIQAEMHRRSEFLRGLPRDVCPESKVTDELANRSELGLHPIVLVVDECQVWFEDLERGEELEALGADLVKRGLVMGRDEATRRVLAVLGEDPTVEHYAYDVWKRSGLSAHRAMRALDDLIAQGHLTQHWRGRDGAGDGRPRRRYVRLAPTAAPTDGPGGADR